MQTLMKTVSFLSLVMLLLLAMNSTCHGQQYTVTVSAGDIDRSESIVTFHFPGKIGPGVYSMSSETGHSALLQVGENNQGSFILDELAAGESRIYRVSADPATAGTSVSKTIDSNTITFRAGGRDVLSYFHRDNSPPDELDDRYKRGGYIHPVKSPNGVVLTNHLNPVQHPHHSGIWSAWTNTRFQGRTPDFWNPHANSGRVDQADSLEMAWDGPVHAGLRAKHHFVDISASAPVIALNEEWEVKVYPSAGGGNFHVFDLTVTQTANTAQPLVLPEYHYGGVGFRGHFDWDDPDNVTFLTSEGLGRDGHGTRVKWTHIGGHSDGELAGIAILGHPSNFRHPQTVRIHPNEPFFNYAPTQLGDMSIEPGTPYVVRYRYITYDGEPDPDAIDRMWQEYAYPPGVTVGYW
jgi:hypothetical protein